MTTPARAANTGESYSSNDDSIIIFVDGLWDTTVRPSPPERRREMLRCLAPELRPPHARDEPEWWRRPIALPRAIWEKLAELASQASQTESGPMTVSEVAAALLERAVKAKYTERGQA